MTAHKEYELVAVRDPEKDKLAFTHEQGQLWRQYYIAGVASISILLTGYAMGWTSPTHVKLVDANLTDSPLPAPITMLEESWIVSLFSVGATIGSILGGVAASWIGRQRGMLASSTFFFAGWLLVAFATRVEYLYAGRFCWGVATGKMFTLAPMYCAEIATDDVRGALGSYLEVFVTVGFMLMYLLGPFVSYAAVAGVGLASTAVFVFTFYFMPESPIYHLTKRNRELAAKCLMQIRGRSREGIEAELELMAINASISMAKQASLLDLFRRTNFKAFYISCALVFFQQFCGICAVLFYLTSIFEASGSKIDSAIATIIVGTVQLLASIMAPLLADRAGRKTLMLVSCAGSALGLGLLGVYFLLEHVDSPAVASASFVPLLSLVIFILTYPMGLGAMTWAIIGEVFTIEVKNIATPIVTSICWLLSIFITRFFAPLTKVLGMHFTFWMFAGFCVLGFIFTLVCIPETKGKSYQEIQAMLSGKKPKPEKV